MIPNFICPGCKLSLVAKNDGYKCLSCGKFYSNNEGYIDFLGVLEFYAGEASQQDMRKLIQDIDLLGYEEALSHLFRSHPNLQDYITDTRRADWLCHCITEKNNLRCLDIGSGLGNISEALSSVFHDVYSLEAVKERIEFQKRRYKNSNRPNITIARANALELPFPDNYFDLVVCNGLLEWIGLMNKSVSPRKAQLEFLREVRRVLSPKGCLYIGIENRFGIWLLGGAKDHSGIPYTSILPRRISNFLVRRYGYAGGIYGDRSKKEREENGYYTYTYSIYGYRSLFKDAGFKVRSFWVYPSYNKPYFSGSVDDKIGLKGFIYHFRDKSTKFRLAMSLAEKLDKSILGFITNLISPSFLFYCYKDEVLQSYDDVVLKEAKLRNYTVMSGGNKIVYLLYNKNAEPIKVVHLRRHKYNFEDHITPQNVMDQSHVKDKGDNVWIEDWIPGRRLNPLRYRESLKAIQWLINFQKTTPVHPTAAKHDSLQEIEVLRKTLERLHEFNTLQNQKWLDDYESYVRCLNIQRTAEHGDFWYGNILFDPRHQQISVTDWEYYREGNPFYDFMLFIMSSMQLPSNSPNDFQSNLVGSGLFSPLMERLQATIKEHFGFELNVPVLLAYTMLRFVVRKASEKNLMDKKSVIYDPVLGTYHKLLNILSVNH